MYPFVVPTGKQRIPITYEFQARTPEQFEAVREIVSSPTFDYAASYHGNPFSSDIGTYGGKFAYMHYNKQGFLVCSLIDSSGRTQSRIVVTDGTLKAKCSPDYELRGPSPPALKM